MSLTIRRNTDYRSDMAIWASAVRTRPASARALVNLGASLGRAGRLPEAIETLQEAVRVSPRDTNAHYNLGIALWRAGRPDQAATALHNALALNPADEQARATLLLVAHAEGSSLE
jgi:Flp pilus assembly protein TadD